MNPIAAAGLVTGVGQSNAAPLTAKIDSKPAGDNKGFASLVQDFVRETNTSQVTSDQAISDFVNKKTDNVQQVIMAVAEAEMSFQMFMEIRNKLVDSYNELMRMQF